MSSHIEKRDDKSILERTINQTPFILYSSRDKGILDYIGPAKSIYKIYRFNGYYLPGLQNYYPLGDLMLRDDDTTFSIILARSDSKVSSFPIDYKKVFGRDDINIWEPIPPKGYTYIGLVASQTRPDLRTIKVVKDKYAKRIINKSKLPIHPMNKFRTLSVLGVESYSIVDDNNSSSYSESIISNEQHNDNLNSCFKGDYSYDNAKISTNYSPWFEMSKENVNLVENVTDNMMSRGVSEPFRGKYSLYILLIFGAVIIFYMVNR